MTVREIEMFALVAAIAALWQQIRNWLAWPVSLLIIHRKVDSYSSGPVLTYLQANAKSRPRDAGYYSSERPFIPSLGRSFRVWYEALREGRQVFWLRRRPVWYRRAEFGPPGQPGSTPITTVGMFSYIRGTLDWERMLGDVATWEDEQLCDLNEGYRNRFAVHYHGKSNVSATHAAAVPAPPTKVNADIPQNGQRLLHWKAGDLAQRTPLPLDLLSLRAELVAVARRVRHWMASKEWCEERGIPWRLGLSLSGAPGTGKTSFARALAVEHNFPIHVFDLAALDNFGLHQAWTSMLCDAPCVALLEDLDCVYGRTGEDGTFDPRAVVAEHAPSFDRLLNCIAGVQSSDGVLLIVTTNRPEALDPALLRRGRLDVQVEVSGLDAAGRRKMIDRILRGMPVDPAMADDPALAGMTPAALQDHLIEIANAARFGDAA